MAGMNWSSGGEAPFSRIGMSAAANNEVSLTNYGAAAGTLRINLRWKQRPNGPVPGGGGGRRGGASRRPAGADRDTRDAVDLDLGCLYEFTDGQRGVIQAVGRRSGDYARPPYIRLDRDDRMGSSTGENLFINMDQHAHFQRILIFVMVAGGANELTDTEAGVTIYPTAGPALDIGLTGPTGVTRARSCAVAQIRREGTQMVVRRELRYFTGYQSEIDTAFSWGLHWAPGPGKAWL
jgi:tellurite resistance protein TerA